MRGVAVVPHQQKEPEWRGSKEFLLTSTTPDGETAAGIMDEVIRNPTSQFTPADLAALIAYLRSLPPLPDEPRD